MPCEDERPYRDWEYEYLIQETSSFQLQQSLVQERQRSDQLAALLCEACSQIEPCHMGAELQKWWNEHQKLDKERKRKQNKERKRKQRVHKEYLESVRKRLMRQLTDIEKEALGLNLEKTQKDC